jgi:hypothetical protein
MKLALRDEEEFTSINLSLTAEGGIDLSGHDMGPTVRRTWGDSDYEYGIRVAPAHTAKLAFALIAEHYHGDLQAVQKVRELAERHGIAAGFWDWA